MSIRRRLTIRTIAGFGTLALAAIVLAPLVGSTSINLRRVIRLLASRSPTTSTRRFSSSRGCRGRWRGRCVGAALASSGVVFQGLLRNPLATPFTLGVSTGAALGAMLAITFDWTLGAAGFAAVPAASFVGAVGAVGIVYALAQARHHGLSTTVLLLAGVTLNAFFSVADPVRAVLRGLHGYVSDAAVAHGRSRRRAAISRSSPRFRCWRCRSSPSRGWRVR